MIGSLEGVRDYQRGFEYGHSFKGFTISMTEQELYRDGWKWAASRDLSKEYERYNSSAD